MAAAAPRTDLRNYALVTGAYWTDTIADGAIRMLVLLYFYERGYSPFEVASLFLFYEVFGIVTNLVGGWLAARFGLATTLVAGLGTQVAALAMLAVAPRVAARRAVRDGRPGAVGHRQGPHEDERQERGQARGPGGGIG
jgi:MFS family permease